MESVSSDRMGLLMSRYQWQYSTSAASVLDPQQRSEEEDTSSSSSRELYAVGFILANIVGVRYYSGNITGRQLVGLVREPLNPYDSNAIQVFNIRNVQVGHVERSVAAALSPLIDENLVKVDGIVPNSGRWGSDGGASRTRIPCQIHLFTSVDGFDKVKDMMMNQSGVHFVLNSDVEFVMSQAIAVKEKTIGDDRSLDEIFKNVEDTVNKRRPWKALEPPSGVIKTKLFDHQKEGLGWLVRRENSDELLPFWEEKDGLYVNLLTNIKTNIRPEPVRGGIFADDMGLGKTLTLLSLIAFDKCNEFGSSIDNESLSSRRNGKRKRVVTRGNVNQTQNLSKTSDATPNTHVLGSRTTLVVFPPSLFSTWLAQLEEHTETGSLKACMFYGDRTRNPEVLDKYDIVLTTYSTLGKEISGVFSPIRDLKWRRVILDEGHSIKNATCQMSHAVSKVRADRRWVVTGTPIQNGTFDLFSMMTFLHYEPFSIRNFWDSLINRPISEGNENGLLRLQAVMATISLRRTKENVSLGLPAKSIETCFVELSREERELYDSLEEEAKSAVRSYINTSRLVFNYSTVLAMILQLRQICISKSLCQRDLVSLFSSDTIADVSNNPELLKKMVSAIQDGEDFDCPICISPPTEIVITCCAHIFCRDCILKALKRAKPSCPLCRRPLLQSDLFSAPPDSSEDIGKSTTSSNKLILSSKVTTLLMFLSASRDENPNIKSVIFSQFPKMLVLLEDPLKQAGFATLRLDGTMDAKKRAKVIKEFGGPSSGKPTILLASLKTSSAGINLTAASRVYLLEPWWNLAVEEQAMDRVHRIGQNDDVKIVRLIARNTIEERVLALQRKKTTLARQAFQTRSLKDCKEVSINDLQTLMAL